MGNLSQSKARLARFDMAKAESGIFCVVSSLIAIPECDYEDYGSSIQAGNLRLSAASHFAGIRSRRSLNSFRCDSSCSRINWNSLSKVIAPTPSKTPLRFN